MTGIALLGCGRIGRMHATHIAAHPKASLAAVYYVQASSAAELSAQPGVPASHSADEKFKSPDIDAVLIATTKDTHADYFERAVASHEFVLCEKPIDLDLGRVERCANLKRHFGVQPIRGKG